MCGEFVCEQCGLCCLGIGEIIRMNEQLADYVFLVKNEADKKMHLVLISPEYRDIFDSDHSIQEQNKLACFFVRRGKDGLFICTIHSSRLCCRLCLCKDKQLCVARISKNGEEVARVKGRVSLVTEDRLLTKIWRDCILKHPDPGHKYIEHLLTRHGYTVLFYESTYFDREFCSIQDNEYPASPVEDS